MADSAHHDASSADPDPSPSLPHAHPSSIQPDVALRPLSAAPTVAGPSRLGPSPARSTKSFFGERLSNFGGGPSSLSESASSRPLSAAESREEEEELSELIRAIKIPDRHKTSDLEYWSVRDKKSLLRLEQLALHRRTSQLSFSESSGEDEAAFDATEKGIELKAHIKELEELCAKHHWMTEQFRKNPKLQSRLSAQVFVQLFRTSALGLGQKQLGGGRDTTLQRQFSEEVRRAYTPATMDPSGNHYCIIMRKDFLPLRNKKTDELESQMKAGHVVAAQHRDALFKLLFDEDELYSARNGIYMSALAEGWFDKSIWTLVPDITGDLTAEKVQEWQQSHPRSYRIQVMQPDHPEMRQLSGEKTFGQHLEGAKPEWKTEHRPRARYLFFHYLKCIMHLYYRGDNQEHVLNKELKRPYWGTVGRYMKRKELSALVEHIGHDYAGLVGEGRDDGDDETDEPELLDTEILTELLETQDDEAHEEREYEEAKAERRAEILKKIDDLNAELQALDADVFKPTPHWKKLSPSADQESGDDQGSEDD